MTWERGMEAADSAAENFLLPADLPGPTDRWRVLLGRKHTEVFLAEQLSIFWCEAHYTSARGPSRCTREAAFVALELPGGTPCSIVKARLVVEP